MGEAAKGEWHNGLGILLGDTGRRRQPPGTMVVVLHERLGAPTSAKGSEFWVFFFEGNKALAWEICSDLRDKDFGESSRGCGITINLGSIPNSAILYLCVTWTSHLTPLSLCFIICEMGLRIFSL